MFEKKFYTISEMTLNKNVILLQYDNTFQEVLKVWSFLFLKGLQIENCSIMDTLSAEYAESNYLLFEHCQDI